MNSLNKIVTLSMCAFSFVYAGSASLKRSADEAGISRDRFVHVGGGGLRWNIVPHSSAQSGNGMGAQHRLYTALKHFRDEVNQGKSDRYAEALGVARENEDHVNGVIRQLAIEIMEELKEKGFIDTNSPQIFSELDWKGSHSSSSCYKKVFFNRSSFTRLSRSSGLRFREMGCQNRRFMRVLPVTEVSVVLNGSDKGPYEGYSERVLSSTDMVELKFDPFKPWKVEDFKNLKEFLKKCRAIKHLKISTTYKFIYEEMREVRDGFEMDSDERCGRSNNLEFIVDVLEGMKLTSLSLKNIRIGDYAAEKLSTYLKDMPYFQDLSVDTVSRESALNLIEFCLAKDIVPHLLRLIISNSADYEGDIPFDISDVLENVPFLEELDLNFTAYQNSKKLFLNLRFVPSLRSLNLEMASSEVSKNLLSLVDACLKRYVPQLRLLDLRENDIEKNKFNMWLDEFPELKKRIAEGSLSVRY